MVGGAASFATSARLELDGRAARSAAFLRQGNRRQKGTGILERDMTDRNGSRQQLRTSR
jgi:hypothetical protein